jgi:hypothetical protein
LVGELIETEKSKSRIGDVGRYLLHGLGIGVIVFGGEFVLLVVSFGNPYSLFYTQAGSPFMGVLFYGLLFALTGGANQIFAEQIWNIKCEQNIGTGMRDGFIILVFFSISFLPLDILFSLMTLGFMVTLTPIQVLVILTIVIPLYVFILGVIGKSEAIFLHVDAEPAIPPDFSEHNYSCPHCSASYYYGPDSIQNGMVTCQNCAKEFSIDKN